MTINVNKNNNLPKKKNVLENVHVNAVCSVLPLVGDHIYQSLKSVTGTTKTIELGTGSPAPVQVM